MQNDQMTLPVLALRGKIVYPETETYFEVSRPRSLKALENAMIHRQLLFLAHQKDPSVEVPGETDLYRVGTVVKVGQMTRSGAGVLRVFVEAVYRARIIQLVEKDGSLFTDCDEIISEDYPDGWGERTALFRSVKDWAR